MRYTILFSIFLLLQFVGCKKNKFSTTPSLKFESVNTTQLHNQQLIRFSLSFTDAEGDLTDSIFVQEIVPNCAGSNIEGLFPLPGFPTTKDQKGGITITFGYNASGYTSVSPQCPPENDTAVFRFALKDKAQHVSDTVSSPVIIIYN
ncbi:MAG: hypothetical protein ABI863_23910 [Ginsengibacter sp.]